MMPPPTITISACVGRLSTMVPLPAILPPRCGPSMASFHWPHPWRYERVSRPRSAGGLRLKTEEPIRIRSQAEARRLIESRDIPYVKLGFTDIDGILRGKYVNRAKFLSALEKGFGF